MSNSWEYTESSIFFEWILNQVHSFKNMEHPAKICDDVGEFCIANNTTYHISFQGDCADDKDGANI